MSVAGHAILEHALSGLREGEVLSLDSVARRAGLTKPGLMYHFPTKRDLMLALLDYVVDGWEQEMCKRLGTGRPAASPKERMLAYLDWSLSGEFDAADLVVIADPRLREPLMTRFAERLQPWLDAPRGLPADARTRLTAVRLIADGGWFADATGIMPLSAAQRRATKALAHNLLTDL